MKILITGASRGIGLAEAEIFDKTENELFLIAQSEASFLQDKFQNATVHFFGADLSKTDSIKAVIQEIEKQTQSLDVLINNVGTMILKKFEAMTDEEIDRLLNLNLRASVLLTKSLLPLLNQSSQPHIVFMSSMAAKSHIVGESVYSATKGAVTNFASVLRSELAPKIKVSTVHSWGVNTFDYEKPELLLTPKNIAETVQFIITRDPNFLMESVELGNIHQWRGAQAPWSPQ